MEALLKHLPVGYIIRYAISISEFADHGVISNHFIMFLCIIVYNTCVNNTAIVMPAGSHAFMKNKKSRCICSFSRDANMSLLNI